MTRETEAVKNTITRKMLGDAGENFALGMLTFHGFPCVKMPDCWPQYDLIVEKNNVLQKISVKTRSKTRSFSESSWFGIDSNATFEWLICVLMVDENTIQAWIVPKNALKKVNKSVKNEAQDKLHNRPTETADRISIKTLQSDKYKKFEANWHMRD